MSRRSLSWLFALVLGMSLPAWSAEELPPPEVTPQPALPTHQLTLVAHVSSGGRLGCDLHTPFETTLSREGDTFVLDYDIRLRGPTSPMVPCVLLPLPVRLSAMLGTLPAGDYDVVVRGTTLGKRNPDQHVSFTVSESLDGLDATGPAPEVIPAEPTSSDPVTILITDGAATNGCDLSMPEPVSIVRNGRQIRVDYALIRIDESQAPPGSPCLGAPTPAHVWAELGRLPAGSYEVAINGSLDGTARPQQQVVFAVTGTADATFIPVNRPLALGLMLVVLGGVAAWRLRAH